MGGEFLRGIADLVLVSLFGLVGLIFPGTAINMDKFLDIALRCFLLKVLCIGDLALGVYRSRVSG